MDMGSRIDCADGIQEYHRQKALLVTTTERIDQLGEGAGGEQIEELLDWVAHFTREHFGFQRRLLNDCSQLQEYFLTRAAIHGQFRRQLAGLCIDIMRGDVTVPARLAALCHELIQDVQAHDAVFAEILRSDDVNRRLRRKARQGQLAADEPGG